MANTIQIKRGNSAPPAGTLLDGELGFDKTNDQLYIGKVDGGNSTTVKIGLKNGVGYNEENQESAIVPLNADTLQGHPASDFRLSNWLPTAAEIGAAPSGYGLGEQAFNAPGNDANQITKCGFFRAYVNTPTGDWWTIQQEDLYGNGLYMIQKASCYAYTHVLHAERMVVNGSFCEWEWVNPKMEVGVEYRTTERWNGSVVYTKLVNLGIVANQGSYSTNVSGNVIRYEAQIPNTGLTVPYNGKNTSHFGDNSIYVGLSTQDGIWYSHWTIGTRYTGKYTAYLQLWYTKN